MLADGITIGFCATINYYRADLTLSAFVIIFIICLLIGFSCRAGRYKIPAQQQAQNVVRHAKTTVHNFNGDQNNQHNNTSQRFAKTKELQSQHTKADSRLQHIYFCTNAQNPIK